MQNKNEPLLLRPSGKDYLWGGSRLNDTIARKNMNRKQTGRYDAYNLTYGNRPELFGAGSPTYSGGTTGSIGTGGGIGGSGGGFKYDIPSEACEQSYP